MTLIDDKNPSLLKFDKLNQPTLLPKSWECVIELKDGFPCLEKFEFEEVLSEQFSEVG